MIEPVADLVLGGLLLLTAFWCALVHHRLRRLRMERTEMEGFITSLTAASERAETAIASLRETAAETERRLREQGENARQRGSELARLIDGGGRLARRLEVDLDQGARLMASSAPGREPGSSWSDRQEAGWRRSGPRPAERAPSSRPAAAPADELLRALETLR